MPLISFTCGTPAEIWGGVSGAASHDAPTCGWMPRVLMEESFGPTRSGRTASTPKTAAGTAATGIPAQRGVPGDRLAGEGGGGRAGGGARLVPPVMGLGLGEGGCQAANMSVMGRRSAAWVVSRGIAAAAVLPYPEAASQCPPSRPASPGPRARRRYCTHLSAPVSVV
jgi:hypothetical protein